MRSSLGVVSTLSNHGIVKFVPEILLQAQKRKKYSPQHMGKFLVSQGNYDKTTLDMHYSIPFIT